MDTMSAFARGEVARSNPNSKIRTLDWDKVAHIIVERKPNHIEAGLEGDLEWTGGTIYEDGKLHKDTSAFVTSIWATPIVIIDGDEEECWVYSNKDNDRKDYFPESFIKILKDNNHSIEWIE